MFAGEKRRAYDRRQYHRRAEIKKNARGKIYGLSVSCISRRKRAGKKIYYIRTAAGMLSVFGQRFDMSVPFSPDVSGMRSDCAF